MKKIIDLKNVSQYTAIIIGIILAAFPQIVKWIFYSTGAFIIIFNIAKYFILRNKEKHYSLFKMFMYSMFGALLILVPAFLEIGIPLVAGAFIFMNGFERLVNAFSLRKDENKWVIPLVVGILFTGFGFYVLANYKKVTEMIIRIIGVIIIVIGISKQFGKKSDSDKPAEVLEVNNFKVKD